MQINMYIYICIYSKQKIVASCKQQVLNSISLMSLRIPRVKLYIFVHLSMLVCKESIQNLC